MTKEQEKKLLNIDNKLDMTSDNEITISLLYQKVDLLEEIIQQLQEENKQKDKMIDEMIEEYEFFHRANIINFCEDKLRKNTCIQDCKNCIKQYFQKKVSNNVD